MNADDRDETIESLRTELAKAKVREEDYKDSGSAMLFMLEDLNESFAAVRRGGREWLATFDAITDPLFIHDEDFNIVRANMAYKEFAGMPFKDLINRPYHKIFPLMDKPFTQCLKEKERAREAGEGIEGEEISLPSISRVFKVRGYPVRDEDGKCLHFVHILEDITEDKLMDAALRQEMEVSANLLSMAEAIARTKDMEKLMEEAVRCAAGILRADACLSYIRPRAVKEFTPSQAFGLSRGDAPLFRTCPLDESFWLVRKAMETKGALISHAPFAFGPGKEGLGALSWLKSPETMLVIPLIGRGGAIGAIIAVYGKRTEFTEADMRVIKGVESQMSLALEEARLYKESVDKALDLSGRIETIKVLHEIDRSILSTLESSEIMETVTRLLSNLVPCDRASIVLVDRERGGFVYHAGFGVDMPKGTFVPFGETSAAEVVDTGNPSFMPDLSAEDNLLPMERRFLADGFLSHIRVPVMVKGAAVAVLTVGARRTGVFSREDLSTLESVASQIGVALENARLFSGLRELFLSTVKALSNAIDAKSPWTMGHSGRVTNLALAIGKELGLNEKIMKDIEIAGPLHDIGKLATYESILDKPGKLTEEESAMMKLHPARGADILGPIAQLKDIIPGVKYHHERYDGGGYPEGLRGEAIPLSARILAVADTVDAMAADRPYRKGLGLDAIIAEIKRCRGAQFDPRAADAFLRAAGAGKIELQPDFKRG